MDRMWFVAALWLALALVAVLAANWLRISTALSEIVVGTVAQLAIGALVGRNALNAKAEWITFLAGTGAIVLTFLAGAELDPAVFRAKWKESTAVGLAGFFGPFFGAAMMAHFVASLGVASQLARGGGALHHLGRGGLRRDAGTRVQSDRLRQGDPGGLLHQRSGHGDRAGPDLLALHHQDLDLPGQSAWCSFWRCRS